MSIINNDLVKVTGTGFTILGISERYQQQPDYCCRNGWHDWKWAGEIIDSVDSVWMDLYICQNCEMEIEDYH